MNLNDHTAPNARIGVEASPRDSIGLSKAHAGDVAGAESFMRFLHSELVGMTVASELPEAVQDRLCIVRNEAIRAAEFCAGYIAANLVKR